MAMKKGKLLVIAGVLTTIGLLLISCGPGAEQPAAEQPTTEQLTTEQPIAEKPAVGGPKGEVTVVETNSGVRNMCDQLTATSVSSGPIKMMLYDSLTWIDSEAKVQPALAESWKVADDWSKIDFTLRQGIKWPNGAPFTAKDVKFSFDKFMEKTTMYHYATDFQKYVKEVRVVDDYHVSVYCNEPFQVIFDRLQASAGMFPKDYYEKLGAAEFAAKPMGLGPFKVIDFKQDQFLNAEGVANHYRQTPYVEKVHLIYVPEATTQLAMLKTGEADIIALSSDQVRDVRNDPKLSIITSGASAQTTIRFHDVMTPEISSPFLDLRVRQATSLAIDRKTACDKAFTGFWEPGYQYLAFYNPGYDPNYPAIPYDPVKAKQLLADAGYPNGFDTTLTFSTASSSIGSKTMSELIASYLSVVGIRCKMMPVDAGTFSTLSNQTARDVRSPKALRGLSTNSVPMWGGIIHSGAAIASQLTSHGSLMGAGCYNLKTEALIDESMNYNVGDPRLAEIAKKINETELADMYHCPLWFGSSQFAVGPKLVADNSLLTPGTGWYGFHFENIKLK
ncbi:MAG: ABC transporter substrate-binding protein [Chloroflexota bacterium]